MVETYRRDDLGRARGRRRLRPAQPLALLAGAPCAASTSRPSRARRSWSAARAGAILDVAVDLRRDSPTYGQWEAHVLDDEKHRQLFVPVGFGHGFAVLSERRRRHLPALQRSTTRLTEAGIAWDDPDVGVDWQVSEPLLSERDKIGPEARRNRRDAAVLGSVGLKRPNGGRLRPNGG